MEGYRALRNETLGVALEQAFGREPLRILEVGCGTELSLEYLAGSPVPHSLFGMDVSDTMLRQAESKASLAGNKPFLALGDAAFLPYRSDSFDVVFATRFIHQFAHEVKRVLWAEFQRVVRLNGLVIVEFYARPYHWVRHFSGARKGRSHEAYFLQYPSMREVRDIVGSDFQILPLRILGSRAIERILGERSTRAVTRVTGRLGSQFLLDEYFVLASQR